MVFGLDGGAPAVQLLLLQVVLQGKAVGLIEGFLLPAVQGIEFALVITIPLFVGGQLLGGDRVTGAQGVVVEIAATVFGVNQAVFFLYPLELPGACQPEPRARHSDRLGLP